ncbi:MAG: aminotransferase class I/II-fold pyridoxal phosphate-dependent enzyme [Geminicoccaceae bacterium]
MLNPALDRLTDFAFARLKTTLAPIEPAGGRDAVIDMSIGEPKHEPPPFLAEVIQANAGDWNRYPPPDGTPSFRQAVSRWLGRRYAVSVDPSCEILPVAGTKEALYLLAQLSAAGQRGTAKPVVLMPNPVYGVYVGAAVMAGAEPVMLDATPESDHLPNLDALTPEQLERTALFYLCSPANPQGRAASQDYLARAIDLARRYGFILAVDECYAELYYDDRPVGALTVAGSSFDNVLVFHSLSKRSNAAGLRSGFVAGDRRLIRGFDRLRRYGAAVQPLPLMAAAEALWDDEDHVRANRALYAEKMACAGRLLRGVIGFERPDGGFFLWLDVGNGEEITRKLYRVCGVKALPGAYLSAPRADGSTPGDGYLRLALVHSLPVVEQGLQRLVRLLTGRA